MELQRVVGNGPASATSASSAATHAFETIESARRALVVLRVVLSVCAAAIVIAAFIQATNRDTFDGSGSSPGKLQLALFLSAISLPLLLVGLVLILSVFASVYIARFEVETRRAQEAPENRAGSRANNGAERAPLLEGRSEPLWRAPAAPVEPDDVQWRPAGS